MRFTFFTLDGGRHPQQQYVWLVRRLSARGPGVCIFEFYRKDTFVSWLMYCYNKFSLKLYSNIAFEIILHYCISWMNYFTKDLLTHSFKGSFVQSKQVQIFYHITTYSYTTCPRKSGPQKLPTSMMLCNIALTPKFRRLHI